MRVKLEGVHRRRWEQGLRKLQADRRFEFTGMSSDGTWWKARRDCVSYYKW